MFCIFIVLCNKILFFWRCFGFWARIRIEPEKTEIRPENTFVYLKVQSETEEFEESRKPNMTLNS